MKVAVLASGPSLTNEDINLIKQAREDGRIQAVIAVSNVGLDKAPWADALVSHDDAWWRNYKDSRKFKGTKVCRHTVFNGIEKFMPSINNGCSSGLMAMEYAVKKYSPDTIIILGFDMHSGEGKMHYFGKHPPKLRQTTSEGFKMHIKQFNSWSGCPVFNATPNSALKKFPLVNLIDIL